MLQGGAMKCMVAVVLLTASSFTFADTEARFTLPSGVNVKITEALFSKDQAKISGCTDTGSTCLINGRVPWGAGFELPKTYVRSISVSFQSKSYLLDSSDMYNAWGIRPLKHPGAIRYFGGNCFDANNCQFRGLFSDAAATFVAEWRVVDGVSTRTVLSSSDDIVQLFKHNIDPPKFNE
jgi:hypothetical protein